MTTGAKWIFIEPNAESPGEARYFFDSQGIEFGWTTHDLDNSAGRYTVVGSPMRSGTPWVAVVRSDTMEVVYNNPSGIEALKAAATELAGL